MPETTPNLYQLNGHSVSLSYSLSDIAGQPTLAFTVGKYKGTAHKKEIHIAKPDLGLGQLITVELKPGANADEPAPRFSFLLPDVTLQAGKQTPFETIGITTNVIRKGPAHQHYTSVMLKGEASFVETLKAHA
jgi:hypothetical protein